MYDQLNEAKFYLLSKTKISARRVVLLGSGLSDVAEAFHIHQRINYNEIPHFPPSSIEGHKGCLVIASVNDTDEKVIFLQGRSHYYEHGNMAKTVFPIRLMGLMGIKELIMTNAVGGTNEKFKSGDLMLIEDHINLMGTNPLIGPNLDQFGPRFPDMSCAYDTELRTRALKAAKVLGLNVHTGIYAALSGPSYETPAEINMLKKLGVDATGMSTVPEVIVANQMGIKVLAISCITNMAAGISKQKLNHREVTKAGEQIKEKLGKLIKQLLMS